MWIVGCSNGPVNEESFATISLNPDSAYEQTFEDLPLGELYNFNLKLAQADQSWVTFWVEGYQYGEQAEPFRLTELSYGKSPDPVVEGSMGFGIINAQDKKKLLFMYAPEVSSVPHEIGELLTADGVRGTSWDYAIGEEEVALAPGETKLLGVYRQVEQSFRTYDYQDQEDLERMIQDDKTVLLLKVKIEVL